MDYEKKYKDALLRAKYYKEGITDRKLEKDENIMDYIFPELKESEDEKIRKGLIKGFQHYDKEAFWGEFTTTEILAWLEKQGQESKKVSIWKHWKNGIAGNDEDKQIYLIKVGNTYHLSSCLHFECDYIELSELDNLMLEKQSEQKPADKVETKQKTVIEKGKWYVCNTARYKDFVVGKAYYCPENGMLKPDENEMARYVARNCFRLWTITDAKDGDVLVDEDNNIGIYKEIESIYWNSYIYLGCDGKLRGFSIGGSHKQIDTRPAIKDEQTILFARMKEAGYEWDAENKKLKSQE